MLQSSDNLFQPSKSANKTSTSVLDITIDDQSVIVSEPVSRTETRIFSFNGNIDQTLAVPHPFQDKNTSVWNEIEKRYERSHSGDMDSEIGTNVPTFQPEVINIKRQCAGMEEELALPTQRFRGLENVSKYLLHVDEPEIDDLTMMLDTNFKAEVSDENGSTVYENSAIVGQQTHEDQSSKKQSITNAFDLEDSVFENLPSRKNTQNLTIRNSKDMTLDSIVQCKERINTPGTQNAISDSSFSLPDEPIPIEYSFGISEPLSSTRVLPTNNKYLINFSTNETNNKDTYTNVTFNYGPASITRHSREFRSATSLQNNTDELCNLEPDQLKRQSEVKKYFLNVSHDASVVDMLSETKIDLIHSDDEDDEVQELVTDCGAANQFLNPKIPLKEAKSDTSTMETMEVGSKASFPFFIEA